jgi:hypothetical protein
MKTLNLVIITTLFLIGICCTNKEPSLNPKGKIVFYTNAKAPSGCDSFAVVVYMGDSLIGSLTKSYLNGYLPVNPASDSILTVEKDQGKYYYYAEAKCGNNVMWGGSIEVSQSSEVKVFLDVNNLKVNEAMKQRLVGKWMIIDPCDSCYTFIFDNNDTIYKKFRWDNEIEKWYYEVVSNDSIKVIRNLQGIYSAWNKSKHKFVFKADGILRIYQFLPDIIGTTGFTDVKLSKPKKQ